METVAFYSYKGGVGRTLLVANTAQFLAMCGRRVVAVDLDLEAPGLHQKLTNRETIVRAKSGKLKGVVDELLAIIEGKSSPKNLGGTLVEVDIPNGSKGSLLVLPAGSAPSHKYWSTLERFHDVLRSTSRSGGLAEAVLELQARIQESLNPDFLLIDSRTGITELGGLATSLLADRVVCLTTTAPESIEGTKVVADALRNAPRLKSQQPLHIDFLITRVTGSRHSSYISRLITGLGWSVSVLPHDSAIANEERVLSGWGPGHLTDSNNDHDDAGTELFTATLDWIASSFPVHKDDAEKARRRMEAVYRTWQYLTQSSERVRGGSRSRDSWPLDQLRERVRFGTEGKSREADIVAYDGPSDHSKSKPLMIIEYVEGEDHAAIAEWWLSQTRVPVVAILSEKSQRKLYSREKRGSEIQGSERWDLPLPHDFKALSNPLDVSVDSLLDAVRRGHPEYLDRIVKEWVHCSAATVHGGAPWRPQIANKILDSLARVDDIELARRILWATSVDPFHRGMWLGDGDEWLDEQVRAELFAPLVWRLPPEASVDILREGGHRGKLHGPPSGLIAVALLARDLLGLKYDPDAAFRIEGQRILNSRVLHQSTEDDRGLYELISAFRNTEISFEFSSELPPLLQTNDGDERDRRRSRQLHDVLGEQITRNTLITTGLLGNYESDKGRVILYKDAISICADKLALRSRHVGSIVLIHETIHALAHIARDLDGRMWNEFALPRTNTPRFEPSWFHETLAQYFTYRQILKLNDSALMHAFEVLSSKQASPYRAWRRIKSLPLEDARNWFLSVRRGISGAPSHRLHVTEDQS